jgi:hypothetical protein
VDEERQTTTERVVKAERIVWLVDRTQDTRPTAEERTAVAMSPSAETSRCFPTHVEGDEKEIYSGLAGNLGRMDGGKEGREEVNEGICIVAVVVGMIVINEVGIRSNGARLLGVIGNERSTVQHAQIKLVGCTWSASLNCQPPR